ncbi:hypothetical protein [Desulfosporosinus sp. OT]|uniref:hypothetical protein n=1 Tax=Desulfosporosinus sp. OT TaxID=913865 RepID=UPI000223A6DC|nr:hypothetical protein [Desulfosporosinus sp. OT]EGW41284.1 hypothetical protein DOT_0769 [Desulfosporosinus sp. OT]
MKMAKKALASFAIAGMVLTMIPFNAFAEDAVSTRTSVEAGTAKQIAVQIVNQSGSSHTATLDQIVTEIMSYRGYLNQSEKDSLNEARTNLLTAVQDGTLSSAADGLLTDQVVAKFQAKGVTRADAKEAILKSLQDFQAIHYSDDNATLESALVKFKTENGRTFRTLFGDGFKVELLYGFMLATQDELQKEIKKEIKQNPFSLLELVSGSDSSTKIKDKLVEWLKTALHDVADPANSKYHIFDQKLADIGWNIDLLVETQRQVGAVIDPSNAAEKAVAMSVIRSQIQCKIDGTICDPLTPLTLKKGANKLKLVLSVKGIDTGTIAGLLAWKTDNPTIATVAEDGSSIKAGTTKGTTVITAYRMNDSQVEANELVRITVAVN